MTLRSFLQDHKIPHIAIARELGITRAAFSYKLKGSRPLKLHEINRILSFCQTYDPALTYEALFGGGKDV